MTRFFDCIIGILIAIWIVGGVPWNGTWVLTYGADLRRAALLIGVGLFLRKSAQSGSVKWFQNAVQTLWRADPHGARWRRRVWSVGLAIAIVTGVAQSYALRFPLFDVGIFNQLLWNISRGNGFWSPVSGVPNFLQDHFSPALAILAPWFAVFGGWPPLIAVLNACLIYSGIFAWIFLSERFPGTGAERRAVLAGTVVLVGVFFDSFWANLRWGFHESSLAFAALSWGIALYFADQKLRRITPGVTILVLIYSFSKEILLLNGAIWMWFFAVDRSAKTSKGVRIGLGMLGLFLVLAFFIFQHSPHPELKNYFRRYYGYMGSGLGEVLQSLIRNPLGIIGSAANSIGIKAWFFYFLALGWPFVFWAGALWRRLPGQSKGVWFCVVPSLASAALSTESHLRDPGFHYVLEIWPVLFFVTLLGISQMRSARVWAWGWIMVTLFLWNNDPLASIRNSLSQVGPVSGLRHQLSLIPIDDSVTADEDAGFWISGRKHLTRWQDSAPSQCGKWVILKRETALEGCLQKSVYWSGDRFVIYR